MLSYIHRSLLCLDFHPSDKITNGLLCFPKLPSEMKEIRDKLDEELKDKPVRNTKPKGEYV